MSSSKFMLPTSPVSPRRHSLAILLVLSPELGASVVVQPAMLALSCPRNRYSASPKSPALLTVSIPADCALECILTASSRPIPARSLP